MRRTRLLTYLIALITLLTGALVFVPSWAEADTADLEIANEAWFGRYKVDDPQAPLPCFPPNTPSTIAATNTYACGPVSPADSPAPQSKATGHYVVASAGGEAGEDDGEGDTAWAAFQWDTFDYLGATAEKFVVRLHLGMDRCGGGYCENQGDTYHGDPSEPVPPIQACNILEAWSGEPGPNQWDTRPKVSNFCVVPTQNPDNLREFVFDVTPFADSWLDGTGHGFVIRPGTPKPTTTVPAQTPPPPVPAFQMTFAGYYDPGTEPPTCNPIGVPGTGTVNTTTPVTTVTSPTATVPRQEDTCEARRTPPAPAPKVTFVFTPAEEDDFFDDFGGGDEDFFEDLEVGEDELLEVEPDLDVIPTDVGSEELSEDVPLEDSGDGDVAAPVETSGRTRPISSDRDTPFPWLVLLLLPLAVMAFWGTGTALGPLGDPVSARRGGVSRVLAERQAAHRGSDTRNLR